MNQISRINIVYKNLNKINEKFKNFSKEFGENYNGQIFFKKFLEGEMTEGITVICFC